MWNFNILTCSFFAKVLILKKKKEKKKKKIFKLQECKQK